MAFLSESWSKAFAPRDRRPTREWAGDYVILGPPLTKSGPFSTVGSRQLEKPIDDLDNDRIRQVNIRAPVRGAKSLVMDIWMPELVARRPGPTMWVMAKDDMIEEHVNMRVIPLLKRCEPAAKYLPADPRKITKSGIDFTHGMNLFFNGPSLSNAQNKPIQNMALDEVWTFKQGAIGEFKGRLGDHEKQETSKLVLASQGGVEDSDWDTEFKSGVLHQWSINCLRCDKRFIPEWEHKREDGSYAGMRWDKHKDDNGFWLVQRCLSSIRYECHFCGHPHTYTTRTMSEWDRKGEYIREDDRDKNKSIHSYEYNAVITRPWHLLVEQFLNASNIAKKGGWLPMVEFWQKRMAKNKSESSFLFSRSAEIRTGEYKATEEWPQELYRAITVDWQKDLQEFWAVGRAYGPDLESRQLFWKHVNKDSVDEAWDELERLREEWKVEPQSVFCDVAYMHKECLGRIAKRDYTGLWGQDVAVFRHTVGERTEQHIYGEQQPPTPQPGMGVYFRWAKVTVADYFDQLKRGLVGKWTASVNCGSTYSDHLNAQYKKADTNKKTGIIQWIWSLRKHGMDDHLLDCERMQVVAASMFGIFDNVFFAAPDAPKDETVRKTNS